MPKNTAIQVQDALDQAASRSPGADLATIIKDAEAAVGIGINESWAVSALNSRGWKVDDVPDRRVTRI